MVNMVLHTESLQCRMCLGDWTESWGQDGLPATMMLKQMAEMTTTVMGMMVVMMRPMTMKGMSCGTTSRLLGIMLVVCMKIAHYWAIE